MAKEILGLIKLQIPAGGANPSPPVGPALGQRGLNIMDFCKAFNATTQDKSGDLIPVEITVYADRSFSFITKTPPAAVLLKKKAGIPKGSGEPNREKVGKVSNDDLILDIGPKTIKKIRDIIERSETILWNGPVGYFENLFLEPIKFSISSPFILYRSSF